MKYLKKHVTLLALIVMLGACNGDIDITPNFEGANYVTETYDAVEGVSDGVATVYRVGGDYYYCNPADNFLYVFSGGAAVLNSDGTQIDCSINIFVHTLISEDIRPVAGNP